MYGQRKKLIVITSGSSARKMLRDESSAVDASIVGIIDEDCKLNF